MAWTEKIGPHSWRCATDDGKIGSLSGFDTKKAAADHTKNWFQNDFASVR